MKRARSTIVFIFNSLDIGGIETKIIDFCKYFSSKSDVKIFLLLKDRTGRLLSSLPKNVRVSSPNTTKNLKVRTFTFPFWIVGKLQKIRPDLILALGNYSGISASIARTFSDSKPSLIISEDSSIDKQLNSDTFTWLRRLLIKICYPMADKIITLSPSGKRKIFKLLNGVDKSKIIVLPNWLPNTYTLDKVKQNSKRSIDMLFMGRFEPQKNPLEFLKITKEVVKGNSNVNIVIVGYGSLESTMRRYVEKNHLTKNVYIQLATIDPLPYYLNSKIFLMTSDHEGFPLTLLEASVAGCVPVCRLMHETREFFDYNPKICQYQSLSSAVKNINNLLLDTKLRKDISKYYQQKVQSTQSMNFNNTVKIIEDYL